MAMLHFVRLMAGVTLMSVTTTAHSACYSGREQLPRATVEAFLERSGDLLGHHPNGGAQLISRTRDLVASNPAALAPVIKLLDNATPEQSRAIGVGLAQASLICARTERLFASQMHPQLASSGNLPAMEAYLGGMGYIASAENRDNGDGKSDQAQVPNSGAGTYSGSSGGGSGGQTTAIGHQTGGSNTSSSTILGTSPTLNQPINYFTAGTNATANLRPWNSTTASQSVSRR